MPVNLVVDPSREQTSNDVKQFCHKVGTTLRILEESTKWANRAERYIGIFKESIRQDMRIANSPLCLWDYCAERRALIHNEVVVESPPVITFFWCEILIDPVYNSMCWAWSVFLYQFPVYYYYVVAYF